MLKILAIVVIIFVVLRQIEKRTNKEEKGSNNTNKEGNCIYNPEFEVYEKPIDGEIKGEVQAYDIKKINSNKVCLVKKDKKIPANKAVKILSKLTGEYTGAKNSAENNMAAMKRYYKIKDSGSNDFCFVPVNIVNLKSTGIQNTWRGFKDNSILGFNNNL